jgi:hypothetical protein
MRGSWSTSSSGIEARPGMVAVEHAGTNFAAESTPPEITTAEREQWHADLTMKTRQQFNIWSSFLLLSCIVLVNCATAQAQKKGKYTCDEVQPESMCNAANTCGSTSAQCTINITRGSYSANVKPGIPDAKNNQLFCIKAGTTVVWMSSNKNNGFMVSFGTDSPFDPDGPIMGGGKKQVTTKASTPGCYKYDAGAFTSGTVYGMSSGSKQELVILP